MKATLIMCFNQSENIKNIQNSLGKDSDWIIDSVINHAISISKYNPWGFEAVT